MRLLLHILSYTVHSAVHVPPTTGLVATIQRSSWWVLKIIITPPCHEFALDATATAVLLAAWCDVMLAHVDTEPDKTNIDR